MARVEMIYIQKKKKKSYLEESVLVIALQSVPVPVPVQLVRLELLGHWSHFQDFRGLLGHQDFPNPNFQDHLNQIKHQDVQDFQPVQDFIS